MIKNKIILSVIAITLFSSLAYSQEKAKIGLSASIQDSQFGILVPIWVKEKIVLAPAIDFKFAEKVGADVSIGLAPRFYFKTENIAPYFGLKIGTIINFPSSKNEIDNETKLDLIGGIAFGAEYFLAERFSLGVEAQGNFSKSNKTSDRFGNPGGLNFNLATMFIATIYF